MVVQLYDKYGSWDEDTNNDSQDKSSDDSSDDENKGNDRDEDRNENKGSDNEDMSIVETNDDDGESDGATITNDIETRSRSSDESLWIF